MDVAIYLFAYWPPATIGLLAVALYARLLSPTGYGHYVIHQVIGMNIAGIFAALFFTWLRLSSRYQAASVNLDLRHRQLRYGLRYRRAYVHPDPDHTNWNGCPARSRGGLFDADAQRLRDEEPTRVHCCQLFYAGLRTAALFKR